MGRWALAGLVLNGVFGSGVYGLPAVVAGKLGSLAWVGVVAAGLVVAVIVACFAEVASRFPGTGGPYLYVTAAFGPYLGIQVGWLHYLTRVASAATNANLFVVYLGEFIPGMDRFGAKAMTVAALFGSLAAVNWIGVKQGAWMSSLSMMVKAVPLVLFAVGGVVVALVRGPVAPSPMAPLTAKAWIDSLLLLVFAYGGFESGMIALGEARDPRRDAPFALFLAIGACIVTYVMVQLATTFSLADPAAHVRSVADAARVLTGPAGGAFMAIGVLLSLFGWFVGAMVVVPRLTFAMARQGALPEVLGRVHPVYRTPHVSIACFALLSAGLTMAGGFLANLTLSVISRLAIYGLVCASVVAFRRRDGTVRAVGEARFRLPWGGGFAAVGVAVALLLATRMSAWEAAIMVVVVGLASANWWLTRSRLKSPAFE